MRINSVNTFNYRNTNFKGLWGKNSNHTDIDPAMCIPVNTKTYYYFPFCDESKDVLKRLKGSIDRAEIVKNDGKDKLEIEECRLCAVFPFTAEQYKAYSQFSEDSVLDDMQRRIHSMVRDKYTDREDGPKQTSALNDTVEQIIINEIKLQHPYLRI